MIEKPVLLTITGPHGANKELLLKALMEDYDFTELFGFTVESSQEGYQKIDRKTFEKRLERGDILQHTELDAGLGVVGYRKQDVDDALLDDRAVKIVQPYVVEGLRDSFAEEQEFMLMSVYVTASSKTLRARLEERYEGDKLADLMSLNKSMFRTQSETRYDYEILHLDESNVHDVIQEMLDRLDI